MADDGSIANVEAEVDRLYGLAPGEFTAARNDLAKALRKQKRKSDADRIAKLPKPTAAAGALNQIARRRPDLVAALIASGGQLRTIQERVLRGDAEAAMLLRASEERRAAIRSIVAVMTESLDAGEARRADDWVRTLEAASVDERLAVLLTHGRFTTVVLEGVGFDGLVAAPDPAPRHLTLVPPLADETVGRVAPSTAAPDVGSANTAEKGRGEDDLAALDAAECERRSQEIVERERVAQEEQAERARATAERIHRARSRAAAARDAADRASRSLAEAIDRHEAAAAAVAEAEAALETRRAELAEAGVHRDGAGAAHAVAVQAMASAASELAAAEVAFDDERSPAHDQR